MEETKEGNYTRNWPEYALEETENKNKFLLIEKE